MFKSIAKINRVDILRPSVLLLISMNLIPLVGVLLLDWNIGFIMLLYWMETVVIGVFNIPKMLSARLPPQGETKRVGLAGGLFFAAFFTVHYGGFNLGHYVFLKDMFDLPPIGLDVLIALAGLTLSHGVSLAVNWFGKREYEKTDPGVQMFKPYGRVILMHVVIIVSGFLVLGFKGALPVLILLIILKTYADVVAHIKGHEFKEMLMEANANSNP